jgi:hypothetical protein
MKRAWAAAAAVAALAAPASAHRLDEYLQATIVSVEQGRLHAFMRLIPGVAVSSAVIAKIDRDGNGVISRAEQQAYADRVLNDLSLTADGHRLQPRLTSVEFPRMDAIKDGLGEIRIEFTADLPGGGKDRNVVIENHHENRISAYLVNSLVPSDQRILVTAQNRNEDQSFYEVRYMVAAPAESGSRAVLGTMALLLFVRVGLVWRKRADCPAVKAVS